MADRDDEQFESYLKSFRPVAPEPLRAAGHGVRAGRRFALAAAVAASLAASQAGPAL